MTKRRVRNVSATAPLRADLAGGTLDLWPLGLLDDGGATVAVALDLRVRAAAGPPRRPGRLELRAEDLARERSSDPAPGGRCRGGPLELLERAARVAVPGVALRLATRSPVRAGSGLGTSSALGVAAAAACRAAAGLPARRPPLVPLVRDLEARVLGIPTGTQDHEAALRGGIVVLEHRPGGPRVTRLAGRPLAVLRECLLPVDSGAGRSSGPSNWDLFRRRIEGDPAAVRAFRRVARAGSRAAEAVAAGDLRGLGRAMREDMAARAEWSPLVLTPALREILAAARRAGALGEKVCGAGGGGYAVILVPPGRREAVTAAVREAGGTPSPARPTGRGLRLEGGRRQRT